MVFGGRSKLATASGGEAAVARSEVLGHLLLDLLLEDLLEERLHALPDPGLHVPLHVLTESSRVESSTSMVANSKLRLMQALLDQPPERLCGVLDHFGSAIRLNKAFAPR